MREPITCFMLCFSPEDGATLGLPHSNPPGSAASFPNTLMRAASAACIFSKKELSIRPMTASTAIIPSSTTDEYSSEVKAKIGLGISTLEAAKERIAWIFDNCPKIVLSFSGGKDSGVMMHLVMEEARRRDRSVAVLFIDLEAQYEATIQFVASMYSTYAAHIEPYWICAELSLRNAVSVFQPQWQAWQPDIEHIWVRPKPAKAYPHRSLPFFQLGMEFEDFVDAFARWYSRGDLVACFVGIRAEESLNRYRTIFNPRKQRLGGHPWTTWMGDAVFNCYPLYDWTTKDIWTFHGRTKLPYNRIYDLMHKAGLTLSQMRLCQPYGDDQRKGLWLFSVLEPETWARVVARVSSANNGAIYAHETGDMLGVRRVSKPAHLSWSEYVKFLLASMPPHAREHYESKIFVFCEWYRKQGQADIPDEADPKLEAAKKAPSWRRVAKCILKNDWWCKSLSFGQHRSGAYEDYIQFVKERRNAARRTRG